MFAIGREFVHGNRNYRVQINRKNDKGLKSTQNVTSITTHYSQKSTSDESVTTNAKKKTRQIAFIDAIKYPTSLAN